MAHEDNPWYQQHKYEYADSREERQLVDLEYAGSEEFTTKCPNEGCEGDLMFKATIGVLKCTHCGQLAHCNGDLIGGLREHEPKQ